MKPETMSSTPTAENRAEAWLTQKGMWPEQMSSRINIGPAKQSPTTKELFATCIREEVEPLEAENVKLRALVQELVNLMQDGMDDYGDYPCFLNGLEEAKSQGFTPTNTTEG